MCIVDIVRKRFGMIVFSRTGFIVPLRLEESAWWPLETNLVLEMISRATGSTGIRGCWKAILTQPFQFLPDGINWSTSSSNYSQINLILF